MKQEKLPDSPAGTAEPLPPPHRRVLRVHSETDEGAAVIKALASEQRRRILDFLSNRACNMSEIAQALDMPPSTVTLHVSTLEETGLLTSEMQPGIRGIQKVCSRAYDVVLVELLHEQPPRTEKSMEIVMPVGAYVDCHAVPPCGLASAHGVIGHFDTPASFYEPARLQAQLLWFRQGYVEYRFPNRLHTSATLESLSLAMELCSEAPLHHDDWLSDITVWVNGVEVGTWTSPADFGGQRGLLTPEWWESRNSQFGLLKVWQVTPSGSYIDGIESAPTRLADLGILERPFITVRIGNRPDAPHLGGLNLFGRAFGNYPQDILLRLLYR